MLEHEFVPSPGGVTLRPLGSATSLPPTLTQSTALQAGGTEAGPCPQAHGKPKGHSEVV